MPLCLHPDHDEVFLAVYEKTGREPNMMQTLWAFRTRITLQDLTSNLNNVPDVKHKYPLLHKFLQEVYTDPFTAKQLPWLSWFTNYVSTCPSDHDFVVWYYLLRFGTFNVKYYISKFKKKEVLIHWLFAEVRLFLPNWSHSLLPIRMAL